MHEENSWEKDSFFPKFFYEEKIVAIVMLCAQIVYLLLNFVVYYIYTVVYAVFRPMIIWYGYECVIRSILSMAVFPHSTSTLLIIILLIYPVTSVLSFCVFAWARITENLQNRKVLFVCNLPLILGCPVVLLFLSFIR